ncbi:RNA polymerase sigma factor [Maritimibacter sp. 55A14]|uniref:RNA polymerase sigma factor n=1 Tax=Maritimibacter sp. 55A14 TaxID=2174844 RepID=UPI001304CCD9|nr:sigma-70 family RNA polymerase sigma factor [Maritimibacter sp. 55A14]
MARLAPEFRAVARHLGGPREQADDLAQDAALRLLARLRSDGRISDPRRYGFSVLRNLWRDRYRRAARQGEPLEEEPPAETPHAASAGLACRDVRAAIARLAPHHRALLTMIAQGTDNYRDLARAQGIAPGTVMSRLSRARRALRAELALGEDDTVMSLLGDEWS